MLLDRDNYLHWSTCHESSNIVSDIFWTHPYAVKLLNAFNIVFLMDTTYKTNKYRLPLLEIVGVTCTCLSFSVGFAFLSSEKEKNFIWALQKFRGSLLISHVGPEVIVCDRDLALMNAINIVFPKARNLLCRFHINKNVKAKFKMLVDSVEAWEVVMDSWRTIIDCTYIAKFDEFVKSFETICSPWPLLVEYVKNTWVELAHWSLKRILQNSMGDLCSCWDAIKHVIILQHNEIKASFEMSLHVIGHTFNVQLYKMLVGFVSKHALILIAEEFDRVNDVGFDSECCGCVLRWTHGLPCACQLARYVMGVIPLNEVHVMWTRLSFSDLSECDSSSELSIQQE
ncbi:protein FAR1-RELATED SEQUENCE 4-like [Phaseolus vulgaris]|uniref:protein FAR1-RELATED SEQUENCE 4-like n=1 Tax=Phaseolus vulgaris TaxID=3885 RepID=UPI0035CC04A4